MRFRLLALALAPAAVAAAIAPAASASTPTASTPAAQAPAAQVSKLLRAKGRFRVRAPRGSKVAHRRRVYVITRRGSRFTIANVRTRQSPRAAGRELARALASTASRVKANRRGYSAVLTPTAGGSKVAVAIRRRGRGRLVVGRTAGGPRGSAAAAAGPRAHAALTAAEVAQLRQLVRTARGGTAITLRSGIPLRKFTAPDGGSSAFVPDRRGWQFGGGGGVVEGVNLAEGAFAFGVSFPVIASSLFPLPPGTITGPLVDAGTALRTVYPAFIATLGVDVQIGQVAVVPGTQGVLGPGFNSAVFTVSLTLNGAPFQGIFTAGSAPIDGSIWQFYYSNVMVRRGADPRLGPALMETWASWDPSADARRRIAQTLQTIRTTPIPGNPIDADVFDEAHAKWVAYIRQ
jgi:hypothetical protein